MVFLCFGFGTLFWHMIVGLDRYEDAWWNKSLVVWILLGVWTGFSLAPSFSNAPLSIFFSHSVVPNSLSHLLKTTFPNNHHLIVGDRLAEDFLFSYFVMVAYLGWERSTKSKAWIANHFTLCLTGLFLFWLGLKVFVVYIVNLGNGGQILGFDVWEAMFNFKGKN